MLCKTNPTVEELKAVAAAIVVSPRVPKDTPVQIHCDENHVTVKDLDDVLITRIARKRYHVPEEDRPSEIRHQERKNNFLDVGFKYVPGDPFW